VTITTTPAQLPRVTRGIPEQRYATLPGAVDPAARPVRSHMTTTAAAAAATDRDPADSAAIVRRIQAGGPDGVRAMGELYERYRDVIFRFVYFRVGNRPIAEDIAQAAWLRALRRLPQYQDQGKDVGAWLVTIARNLVADHYKSGRYRLEVTTGDVLDTDQTDDHRFADPIDVVGAMDESSRLVQLVRKLNPQQQEVIILRFFGGRSVTETAEAMGKNEGAVKALQMRATRALHRLLHEQPGGEG
jgi:RNA polymerase sigma-70 factor (ECF subfamily)